MSDHTRADEGEGREPGQDDEARALIASLEKELGVTGTANVFRKALALAKEASALARARQASRLCRDLEELSGWLAVARQDSSACLIADAANAIAAAETRAEAEVARLTAALAEAEQERDAAVSVQEMCAMSGGFYARHSENATNRAEAAEASASVLRERVATLEAALRPFAEASENLDDGQSGHLWESPAAMALDAEHLRAARTALEAPHEDN